MAITRRFEDWSTPVLPAAADYLIERFVDDGELDLSNVVTVFTGRRAARRMLEILVDRCEDRWPAFRPPRMITFQRLPELLYPQRRQLADELTQLLVWKKALSSVPPDEIRAALPTIPGEEAIPAWMALCESLRKQHTELAADGLEFDDVSKRLFESGNREEGQRWQALRRIQAEYLWQMDELQLWDGQAARLVAVQQHECQADFDIVLIGTVDMNCIVRQMLEQVADRVTAFIHAPESEAAAFDEFGCLKADAWTNRRLNIPLASTRIVDTPGDQALAVVRELAVDAAGAAGGGEDGMSGSRPSAASGSRRADEVVIGVANEALVPAILQGLSDAGVSGRWPVGSELRAGRPYRLLEAVAAHLATARDGLPADFKTMSDLLRHPDMEPWVQKRMRQHRTTAHATRHWLSQFDDYLAEHLQATPGETLGKPAVRNVVSAICASVDSLLINLLPPPDQQRVDLRHSGTTTRGRQRQLEFDDRVDARPASLQSLLAQKRPLAVWANGVLSLLAAVHEDYTFGESAHRDEAISASCAALADCTDALGKIPDAVMPRCSASQAIPLLLRQIEDASVPPAADDEAIDLLGWLELSMDDSPELILTGFNEGFVPESMTSDVFLPNSLRAKLGLLDNRRRYARDAYALTCMLHSRERVTFIAGRTDADGNPLTPSRLWFAVAPDELPQRVQWFYGEDPASRPAASQVTLAAEVSAPTLGKPALRLSGFTVPEPPVTPPAPVKISVTAFRDYLNCPYRYFLKHELKLKAVDGETRELTAAAFGSLMHQVLNEFGESDYAHAITCEPIERFLLDALHEQARRQFGRNRSATVAVQLQMVADRLKAFADCQAKLAQEGWRIRHTEADLVYNEFTDAHGRPVALKGRVDRVDRNEATGEWRVLDYKTSETARKPERTHQHKGEWIDLQLPLYRLLVRAKDIDGDIQLGYLHLPGDLSTVGVSIAQWSREDLTAAEEVAAVVAGQILDLQINRVAAGNDQVATEYAHICQDTVIEPNIPWLATWSGRQTATADDPSER